MYLFQNFVNEVVHVGDRGPLDLVVWIVSVTSDFGYVRSLCGKVLLALVVRYTRTLLLDAPLHELLRRKVEHPLRFMILQVVTYRALARCLGIPIVSTFGVSPAATLISVLSSAQLSQASSVFSTTQYHHSR